MLSWSSQEHGVDLDLTAARRGAPVGELAVDGAAELLAFADAATAGRGGVASRDVACARVALIDRLGESAALDAAAVVANFEMMTRLADGTGARMTEEQVVERSAVSEALGVSRVTSRR
jgi:hypothetical protein